MGCSLCDGSAIIVASKLTLASNPSSAILTPDRQLPEASLASPRLPRTFAILTDYFSEHYHLLLTVRLHLHRFHNGQRTKF